jgi:hypothetical protein
MDADLQQRAVEYAALVHDPARAAQQYVLPMPKWEERESMLLRRLQQQEGGDDEAMSPTAAAAAITSPRHLPSQEAPTGGHGGALGKLPLCSCSGDWEAGLGGGLVRAGRSVCP